MTNEYSFQTPASNEVNMMIKILLYYFIILRFLLNGAQINCYEGNSTDYNGFQNKTATGHTCERWDAHLSNMDTIWSFDGDGSVHEAHNYCRDPNSSGNVWCFSSNPEVEMETCDVEMCNNTSMELAYWVGSSASSLAKSFSDIWKCHENYSVGCLKNETKVCFNVTSAGSCVKYLCCVNRGCFEGATYEYIGTWRYTYTYKECVFWETLPKPILEAFSNVSLAKANNYCRDFNNEGVLYCYTSNETKVSCGIPSCSEQAAMNQYNNSCHGITANDRLDALIDGLPISATDEEVCNSLPYKTYLNSSDEIPGCHGCNCCQVKGCYEVTPTAYFGTWSHSVTGRPCKRWEDLKEFKYKYIAVPYMENYCRVYQGVFGCIISDDSANSSKFEECSIELCQPPNIQEVEKPGDKIKVYVNEGNNSSKELGYLVGSTTKGLAKTFSDLWKCNGSYNIDCLNNETKLCLNVTGEGTCVKSLCCGVNRGCFNGSTSEYKGSWRYTYTYRECVPWETLSMPILEAFSNVSLANASNYCRDFNNEGVLYCYTTNETKVSCGIPSCSEQATMNRYNNSCYGITTMDRLDAFADGLPISATDEEVCKSLPDKSNLNSSDAIPGCHGCNCCQVKGCYEDKPETYLGTWSHSITGRPCKRWEDLEENIYEFIFMENYCRVYQGVLGCIISDDSANSSKFEECSIELCQPPATLVVEKTGKDLNESNNSSKEFAYLVGSTDNGLAKTFSDLWKCNMSYNIDCLNNETKLCLNETSEGTCVTSLCCGVNRGCFEGSTSEYIGTWRYTYTYKECVLWETLLKPILEEFSNVLIAKANNYCRDFNNEGVLYCYTANETKVSCGIPSCSEQAAMNRYNNSCHDITWTDRLIVFSTQDVPLLASEEQVCRSLPDKTYLNSSDEIPGCRGCSCCQVKDCYSELPENYRGTWYHTVTGRLCKRWEDVAEIKQSKHSDSFVENYCREYNGVVGCFISDDSVNSSKFEKCPIELCPEFTLLQLSTETPTTETLTNEITQPYQNLFTKPAAASRNEIQIRLLLFEVLSIINIFIFSK